MEAAVCATITLVLEILERVWEKYIERRKPRLIPSGYGRDAKQIEKERLAKAEYQNIERTLEAVRKTISGAKYLAGIVTVIVAWADTLK